MSVDRGEAAAAGILEGFAQQMRAVAEVSRKRAQLTAGGTAAGGRITVVVNADHIVIATRFSPDIDELTPDELAKGVTAAAQKAAAEVARLTKELLQPIRDERARLPKLSELIEGMPDVQALAPLDPPVSLAPPNSRERLSQRDAPAVEFTDALDYDDWRSSGSSGGATSREW
ncbi:YbaB/EbfC family nucleoid-associated protein [Nocardia jejuensis]|uniref:YbaB/EbfC family nucleoid-associated protein n=1 Tax=Nocardia jejuensis TaxID=328049 RepID=UPI00083041DB|nr:YbaB/EbfC family nucleoid-associated protein [Nocardia jejuensis]